MGTRFSPTIFLETSKDVLTQSAGYSLYSKIYIHPELKGKKPAVLPVITIRLYWRTTTPKLVHYCSSSNVIYTFILDKYSQQDCWGERGARFAFSVPSWIYDWRVRPLSCFFPLSNLFILFFTSPEACFTKRDRLDNHNSTFF